MTNEQFLKNLQVPSGKIDVILDTDAFNEIDDQFAIAYMLKNKQKFNVVGITTATFFNSKSTSFADGMIKSYNEILKLLTLAGEEELKKSVYKGSLNVLKDENTPAVSDAAYFIAEKANEYNEENPLYIVAIGAITNVASAFIVNPDMKDKVVVVWLGGHAHHFHDTTEFNMVQDIAAARVVFNSGAPLVQLPCAGVVSAFAVSKQELEHFLMDKNPLADYLARNTIAAADKYAAGRDWTRVIWDVTAVAWLKNRGDRFLLSRLVPAPLPTYERQYEQRGDAAFMRYVYYVNRDELMNDLFSVVKA
jgi:inosine-uridine nucleoside N-ribohydrolase